MTQLNRAKEAVAELRRQLLRGGPEELEAAGIAVNTAIDSMAALKREGPMPEHAPELKSLSADLDRCRKLIENGIIASRTLSGIIAAASGEYMRDGVSTFVAAPMKISVQG